MLSQPANFMLPLARCQPAHALATSNAARQGFLSGLNDVLLFGGVLALIGAVAGAVLVRETRDRP